jgi:hypothetical protein
MIHADRQVTEHAAATKHVIENLAPKKNAKNRRGCLVVRSPLGRAACSCDLAAHGVVELHRLHHRLHQRGGSRPFSANNHHFDSVGVASAAIVLLSSAKEQAKVADEAIDIVARAKRLRFSVRALKLDLSRAEADSHAFHSRQTPRFSHPPPSILDSNRSNEAANYSRGQATFCSLSFLHSAILFQLDPYRYFDPYLYLYPHLYLYLYLGLYLY